VMVDALSGFTVAVPVKSTSVATSLETFRTHWVNRFEAPVCVRYDAGSAFKGIWAASLEAMGIFPMPSVAGEKNGNGIVERAIRTLNARFNAMNRSPTSWVTDASEVMRRHNASATASGISPFHFLFGQPPRSPHAGPVPKLIPDEDVMTYRRIEMAEILERHVRAHREARREMVAVAKAKITKRREYKPGQYVHVYWVNDESAECKKLSSRWRGPFKVMPRVVGDHEPLIRVQTHTMDAVNGELYHPDRLKLFAPFTPRYLFDPTPEPELPFTKQENGSYPGSLGLTDAELDELSDVLHNSQPLVPMFDQLDASDMASECFACLGKVLVTVPATRCSFCSALVHNECLLGPNRAAKDIPAAYRCPDCIRELPAAFAFAELKLATRSLSLTDAIWAELGVKRSVYAKVAPAPKAPAAPVAPLPEVVADLAVRGRGKSRGRPPGRGRGRGRGGRGRGGRGGAKSVHVVINEDFVCVYDEE
jgi:hypothetical protein